MAQLSQYIFLCLLLACTVNAHKCTHDEYIATNNFTDTVSPQTYLNHPFEIPEDADVVVNSSRRLASANWQPIRFHIDTSDVEKNHLQGDSKEKFDLLVSKYLPLAIKVLTKYLHVIPVDGNLKVTPTCPYKIDGKPCCGTDDRCKWSKNTCFGVDVPESHKNTGIPDTDFALYVSANNDDHGSTLANGGTCRTDQHGRPTAGHIEINLKSIKDDFWANYVTAVLSHELSHALGWHMNGFKKFRDASGALRYPIITDSSETEFSLNKAVTLLTTPTVKKHLRAHFGCNHVVGMELEDQGGTGTAGSHPEKRIFPESYMAGVTREDITNYIIDAVSLSVFQDSGWYQVKNLEEAGQLSFGRGMGCRVVNHRCNDWGQDASEKGMFCAKDTQAFCSGNAKHVLSYCGIGKFHSPLPSSYQYFPATPSVGGVVPLTDYCPRAARYRNGDCTDGAYAKVNQDEAFGTLVGSYSRCFVSSLLSQRYRAHDFPPAPRCHRTACTAKFLQIYVGYDKLVSCPVSKYSTEVTVDGYYGTITCPPYIGLHDVRCNAVCRANDIKCLGKKGSALPGMSTAQKPRERPVNPGGGGGKSVFEAIQQWLNGGGGGPPVVVKGRQLRH